MVNPSLYVKAPYDPIKDFAPVTLAAATPNVLLVHPSIPANNVKELIAFLQANNGKYSYAHSGIGTTSHLSGEMFKHSQGIDLVSVPFNGAAPAVQSTLAGHTPIAFTVLTPAVPQVKEGKLRALAVTTSKRTPALPDVPTMAEAGLPGQESDTISGVLVPTGTPQTIIATLHAEIGKAMAEPEAAQKLERRWDLRRSAARRTSSPRASGPTSRNGRRSSCAANIKVGNRTVLDRWRRQASAKP